MRTHRTSRQLNCTNQISDKKKVFLLVTVGLALFATPAFAYLDPGSAGLAYQIALPVVVFLLTAWRWVISKISSVIEWLKSVFLQ
jgi:hypothetical protein